MEKIIVRVLDFAENPGPRYRRQGVNSGEEYYIKILNPQMAECIRHSKEMVVILDGTSGYPSSFLDQAFGELVYDFGLKAAQKHVHFAETIINRRRVNKLLTETFPQWEEKRNTEVIQHDPIVYGLYFINKDSQEFDKRNR